MTGGRAAAAIKVVQRVVGAASPDKSTLRLALLQTPVDHDKAVSIESAALSIATAAKENVDVCLLGEMFCSRYQTKFFRTYQEPVPRVGEAAEGNATSAMAMLGAAAKKHGLWVVGGSVPEVDGAHIYNTCVAIDPQGVIVAKHRKTHLFDIDVPQSESHPGIKFMESEVLTAGEDCTASVFDHPKCRIGLGICYDIRFPELSLNLTKRGAQLILFPGAFNQTTGPLHWELLARGRAVDNQVYVACCSPSRSPNPDDYQAYGHSLAVSPWGKVLGQLDDQPGAMIVDFALEEVAKMRLQIPTSRQKRADLYHPYAAVHATPG
jgi:omega-amidase